LPRFQALSLDRIQELTRRSSAGLIDLTEHKNWINEALANAQGWGEINLDPTDNIRAIKRRTTIAGKELNKVVKWHRKSTPDTLIFQAFAADTAPAKRRRSKKN
jgi:hypothetical protein